MLRVISCVGLVCVLGAAAPGQTFVTYFMAGENLSDAGRGLDRASVGDVIRVRLAVEHDAFSYAGGKAEMLYAGVSESDITITEDAFGQPFDPWEIGRHVILRIVASDGPSDSTQPHNVDVIASDAFGKVTDENDDFFDFASTPPGLGGIEPDLIESGESIFVFDYVYGGGEDLWDAGHDGEARVWRDGQDINGLVVPALSGNTLVVSPAPGGVALLGLGTIGGCRRRRDLILEAGVCGGVLTGQRSH